MPRSRGEEPNPFKLTQEEIESLDPNYKKPKKVIFASDCSTGFLKMFLCNFYYLFVYLFLIFVCFWTVLGSF